MKTDRIIAIVMILGSSVLVAWTSADIAFPAILCMLGLVGLHGRLTWGIRPERRFITALLLLLLAVLFSLHCGYADPPNDEVAAFAWQTISRYFLASMILVLFLRPREPSRIVEADPCAWVGRPAPLPPSLGLFHLATAMACGQVLLLDDRYIVFRLVELASVTLVVLYAVCAGQDADLVPTLARRESRHRLSLCTSRLAILVVILNIGWVGGSLLYGRVESLNLLPNWLWHASLPLDPSVTATSEVGFSTSGRLNGVLSIMEETNPDPVLRIISNVSPGYMRAKAFEQYRQSEWHDRPTRDYLEPEQSFLVTRANLFRLNDREATKEMTVRHESLVEDVMFTPLGACTVQVPLGTLGYDDDGIVAPYKARTNLTYKITYTTSPGGEPPRGSVLAQTLDVPPQLDPRIRQLATKIFRGCTTTTEKIEAVTRYFHTNYGYSLGLETPLDQDKLAYFLVEASTGYCEYFASGAAILLRLEKVPTRYVTGFLVTQRDEDGKSWIARNTDAHAWVEAWDQEHNAWTIVEATPEDDLAGNSLADQLLGDQSGGHLLLAQLIQAVYDNGLFGVIGWFFDVYSLRTAVSVSTAFLGAAVCLALLRHYGRVRRLAHPKSPLTSELQVLHKMLAAMDRKLKSGGTRRRPDETLHAFANRIRYSSLVAHRASENLGNESQDTNAEGRATKDAPGFSDWYLAYASLRYRKEVSPDCLADLHRLAQELRNAP